MTVDVKVLDQLMEVIGDDHESLMELVDSFLTDGPELLAAMKSGLKAGDAAVVARSAHTLSSGCRDFGLMELSDICLQLELKSKTGDLHDAAAMASQINSLFRDSEAELVKAAEGLSD